MNTYHYSLEGKSYGPVSLEQLQGFNITKETLVWKEGLDHWVQAGELEELEVLFKAVPPPLNQTVPPPLQKAVPTVPSEDAEEKRDRVNKIFIWSGIAIGLLVFIILIMNIGKSKKSNNKEQSTSVAGTPATEEAPVSEAASPAALAPESYQYKTNPQTAYIPKKAKKKTEDEIREELYNKEVSNPKKHLNLEYKLKYKVLSGKDEITGTVFNNATIAGFKDIVLKIDYKSETSAVLKTEYCTIYKYVYAYESVPFTIKTYSPIGTRFIGVDISGADNAY